MHTQTIANTIPLLGLIDQPAFCVCADGEIHANFAARHLAPSPSQTLVQWLGDAADTYARWPGSGILELPVIIEGSLFQVRISTLADGVLCLLSACHQTEHSLSALSVASQVLRQPLTELSGYLRHLSDDLGDTPQTSAMNRHFYRLSRIVSNLSELERLSDPDCVLNRSRLELPEDLTAFQTEAEELLLEAGRTLLWRTAHKPITIYADCLLLKRAILNLLSNAVKYSPAGTPVSLRTSATDTHFLVQIENTCEESTADLLRAAFRRMEERGIIPDPRWGMGIGLPLTQRIASLHGGMVALEARNSTVTVTLSIGRKRPSGTAALRMPVFEYTGGMSQTLLELADVLPNILYHTDAL